MHRLVALAARGSAGNVGAQVPLTRSPCDNRSQRMAPDVMGSPMNERWSGLSKMNWSVGVFVERPAPVKNHWQVLLKPFVGQSTAPGPVPILVLFSRTRIAIAFWPDSAAKLTDVDQPGREVATAGGKVSADGAAWTCLAVHDLVANLCVAGVRVSTGGAPCITEPRSIAAFSRAPQAVVVALKYSLQPKLAPSSHTLLTSGGPFVTPAPLRIRG